VSEDSDDHLADENSVQGSEHMDVDDDVASEAPPESASEPAGEYEESLGGSDLDGEYQPGQLREEDDDEEMELKDEEPDTLLTKKKGVVGKKEKKGVLECQKVDGYRKQIEGSVITANSGSGLLIPKRYVLYPGLDGFKSSTFTAN
jgi:hypothetical protein